MVPEWLKKNDGPTISVKIMAGIPSLTPEEKQNPKKMKSAYERLSFGGSTRKSLRNFARQVPRRHMLTAAV
jgi:hypothetical protein